jgi:hypothetical protein
MFVLTNHQPNVAILHVPEQTKIKASQSQVAEIARQLILVVT